MIVNIVGTSGACILLVSVGKLYLTLLRRQSAKVSATFFVVPAVVIVGNAAFKATYQSHVGIIYPLVAAEGLSAILLVTRGKPLDFCDISFAGLEDGQCLLAIKMSCRTVFGEPKANLSDCFSYSFS